MTQRLADAEATLEAIREGNVDAIVVQGREGQQVYTLESVDLPYRQFLEQMGEGAVSLDSSARIVYCNRFFVELVGRMREAVLGVPLESFVTAETRAAFREGLKATEPQRIGAGLVGADGRVLPVQISLTSTRQETPRRWVAVISDVSGLERLHAVSAAHEAAEAASLAKDQFLALVGHELRTPLAVMMGWTDYLLLQKTVDEARTKKALQTIKRNAQLQQKLIEDLLDVSRIVSGKLTVEHKDLDVSLLANDVGNALALRAEAAGVRLSVEIGEPALVSGDPQRLEQVLTNVLGNAIKFTPPGGRVRLSVASVGERARIEIQDSGEGIDPGMLPRIFQVFRQGGDGKRKRESGLGLGLTITKHLVEAHDGTVRATSDGLGKGTTFIIELPLLGGPLTPEQRSGPPSSLSSEMLPASRVLVVDDEQEMREVTARLLRSFGAEVVDVGDATSALAWLEKEQFDLVVSDIMMPGVDGMEFARSMRVRFGTKRPLLALTALSGQTAMNQAKSAGFTAFLTKPVSRQTLFRAVRDLLVGSEHA